MHLKLHKVLRQTDILNQTQLLRHSFSVKVNTLVQLVLSLQQWNIVIKPEVSAIILIYHSIVRDGFGLKQ